MKTVEETRRELFKEHIRQTSPEDYAVDGEALFQWRDGTFVWHWVRMQWETWNAALGAACIELPAKWDPVIDGRGKGMYAEDEARDGAIDACRAAIESTNLGIKIK